jgi:hypothetical protein
MSTDLWAVLGVLALAIVVVLIVGGMVRRGRTMSLTPLPAESRDRYLADWDQIEIRFIESPEDAAHQADALVMAVMRERGHSLRGRDLPKEVRSARDVAASRKIDRTEAMRRAMLHYRAAMEEVVGAEARSRDRARRRELA